MYRDMPNKYSKKLDPYTIEFAENGNTVRVRAKTSTSNIAASGPHKKFTDAVRDLADRL